MDVKLICIYGVWMHLITLLKYNHRQTEYNIGYTACKQLCTAMQIDNEHRN